MKLEIFEKSTSPPPEEPVRLALESTFGCVYLVAVDRSGSRLSDGYILRITSNGTIMRHLAVNKSLGFQLDGVGRVKVDS